MIYYPKVNKVNQKISKESKTKYFSNNERRFDAATSARWSR